MCSITECILWELSCASGGNCPAPLCTPACPALIALHGWYRTRLIFDVILCLVLAERQIQVGNKSIVYVVEWATQPDAKASCRTRGGEVGGLLFSTLGALGAWLSLYRALLRCRYVLHSTLVTSSVAWSRNVTRVKHAWKRTRVDKPGSVSPEEYVQRWNYNLCVMCFAAGYVGNCCPACCSCVGGKWCVVRHLDRT